MKIKIPHPDGVRYWPESYLPQMIDGFYYVCPLDPSTEDGEVNMVPWDVHKDTGCIMTQAHHDPVFLVRSDLHLLNINLGTPKGVKNYLAILSKIVVQDVRGYLKPQLGSIGQALKTAADLEDWALFIEKLENLEDEFELLTEQIQDEDLAESRARQQDGYIKVSEEEQSKLLAEIMEGKTK